MIFMVSSLTITSRFLSSSSGGFLPSDSLMDWTLHLPCIMSRSFFAGSPPLARPANANTATVTIPTAFFIRHPPSQAADANFDLALGFLEDRERTAVALGA